MALSLSFLTSTTVDKPAGLSIHNCTRRRANWTANAICSSKPAATFDALKATENRLGTKPNSIPCAGRGRSGNYDKAGRGALGTNFRSSFSGKNLYKNYPLTRNAGAVSRSRATISSLLGRKVKKETIIPDPDYRIPIVLIASAGGFAYVDNLAAAVPIGLLGLLLLVQATRVRFVFDGDSLEVKIGDQLKDSGENAFVGGENRWKYSTFVNWELWWPNFPILVYFKETQTKPEGQIHFFPVIFNGKQLYNVMVERCGPSKTSGPK